MIDVSIVTETSQEANWNGQAGGQDHVLSQADALTKKMGKRVSQQVNIDFLTDFHTSPFYNQKRLGKSVSQQVSTDI